jgi:hypothetical protein
MGIAVETEFAAGRVDGAAGRLVSWAERELAFDLPVTVPLHGGAPFVGRSPGLGDELDFVATDVHTLRSKAAPNVFALGEMAPGIARANGIDELTSEHWRVIRFMRAAYVENGSAHHHRRRLLRARRRRRDHLHLAALP